MAVSEQPFATQRVKDLTVTFVDSTGQLQNGINDILIEFRDTASGEIVDVGTVKFDLDMNMPGMVMHSATLNRTSTGTPGRYQGRRSSPTWLAIGKVTLRYDGPQRQRQREFFQ